MSAGKDALLTHLQSGVTSVARCYAVTRRDGMRLGFTDHDRDLAFGGVTFRADTGITAKALSQATGLAVDNTEAFGALRSDAISEEDISAGRFDGAEIEAWLVNWRNVDDRMLQFRGTFGEITRAGGAFTAEVRGLSEALNRPHGRIYHSRCSAVFGDAACGIDAALPAYRHEAPLVALEGGRSMVVSGASGFADGWFRSGVAEILTGRAAGFVSSLRDDRGVNSAGDRAVELWQSPVVVPVAGDMVRLTAGCDKTAATCRNRFANFLNFRGFPDIPGEDWLMAVPRRSGRNDGSSRK